MLMESAVRASREVYAGGFDFSTADLEKVVQLSASARHREKDLLYTQGDSAGHLYVVEYGCIRTSLVTPEGRRLVTGFHFPGDVFGFDLGTDRRETADALVPTSTRRFKVGAREWGSPIVGEFLQRNLNRIQRHLLVLGTQNAIERVAAFLVELADTQDQGKKIRLPMSRCDIADYLGLTLETVSRTLHRLQVLGLIDLISARLILLRDRQSLLAMCD